MSTILPFQIGIPRYRMITQLGSDDVVIDVRYNSREDRFYLDFFENSQRPIVLDIKVVLGINLGYGATTHPVFLRNRLIAIDTTGKGREAGLYDLGERVQVINTPMSELMTAGLRTIL